MIFLFAAVAGIAGFFRGSFLPGETWADWQEIFGVEDIKAFGLVGTIHNYGYAGALAGLIVAAAIQISQPSR